MYKLRVMFLTFILMLISTGSILASRIEVSEDMCDKQFIMYIGTWKNDNQGAYMQINEPEKFGGCKYVGYDTPYFGWIWVADFLNDLKYNSTNNKYEYTFHACYFDRFGYIRKDNTGKVTSEGYRIKDNQIPIRVMDEDELMTKLESEVMTSFQVRQDPIDVEDREISKYSDATYYIGEKLEGISPGTVVLLRFQNKQIGYYQVTSASAKLCKLKELPMGELYANGSITPDNTQGFTYLARSNVPVIGMLTTEVGYWEKQREWWKFKTLKGDYVGNGSAGWKWICDFTNFTQGEQNLYKCCYFDQSGNLVIQEGVTNSDGYLIDLDGKVISEIY